MRGRICPLTGGKPLPLRAGHNPNGPGGPNDPNWPGYDELVKMPGVKNTSLAVAENETTAVRAIERLKKSEGYSRNIRKNSEYGKIAGMLNADVLDAARAGKISGYQAAATENIRQLIDNGAVIRAEKTDFVGLAGAKMLTIAAPAEFSDGVKGKVTFRLREVKGLFRNSLELTGIPEFMQVTDEYGEGTGNGKKGAKASPFSTLPHRQDYFPHLRSGGGDIVAKAMAKMGLGEGSLLPTEIAGKTAGRKPGRTWNRFAQERKGGKRKFEYYQDMPAFR